VAFGGKALFKPLDRFVDRECGFTRAEKRCVARVEMLPADGSIG